MSEPEQSHVENTVQQMAELHAEHVRNTTPLQKRIDAVTSWLGRPQLVLWTFGAVVLWVGGNLALAQAGLPAPDPPPFATIELAATILALLATILILATQRREDEAARHRAQLTLQLAALSEQKIAKVIQLLEEQRAESPYLRSRPDQEADEMANAADPRHVLDRIIETHEEIENPTR